MVCQPAARRMQRRAPCATLAQARPLATRWRGDRCARVRALAGPDTPKIAELNDCSVLTVSGGYTPVRFGSAWEPVPGKLNLLIFFTHWADLGSWELAQRLNTKWAELNAKGVEVTAVGLGSPAGGAKFAGLTGFPAERLYADPASACHRVLGFSPGFLAGASVNGYIKIFPMLAGIGSPGTIQEVLSGYTGSERRPPIFEGSSMLGQAFQLVGSGYQRPFELATLRLQNMIGSLTNWADLAPQDDQQLVQQGGCLLFNGDTPVFSHEDTGILMTADVEQIMASIAREYNKNAAEEAVAVTQDVAASSASE